MTLVEKILAKNAGLPEVKPGQYVEALVDLVILSDVAIRSVKAFYEIGAKKVYAPNRIALVFDHNVPARDTKTAEDIRLLKEFAETQGIHHLFDLPRGGIQHLVPAENGLIYPGMIVIDGSHTCTDGALGVLATGVSAEDRAVAMATGKLWFRVPETLRVVLGGRPRPFLTGMDIGLALLGKIKANGAMYLAVEFAGETLDYLPMDTRFTLCNLTMEAGAKTGIIEVDEKTLDFYRTLGLPVPEKYVKGDPDSSIKETIQIDVEALPLQVAQPSSPDNVSALEKVLGTPITHGFIGYCVNGRVSDLALAAGVLKGKQVNPKVNLTITPGSQKILREAIKKGYITTFLEAGAVIAPPTCGACAGIHMGVLGPGDTAISTTNRNFPGRMGHLQSRVYLANPAVVAASAVRGVISSPEEVLF
jgi:3-isopropylmalate/(R)-2-methylmalate dehydratase large subunit